MYSRANQTVKRPLNTCESSLVGSRSGQEIDNMNLGNPYGLLFAGSRITKQAELADITRGTALMT
jgi:hypothetical protein